MGDFQAPVGGVLFGEGTKVSPFCFFAPKRENLKLYHRRGVMPGGEYKNIYKYPYGNIEQYESPSTGQ